MRYDEDLNEIYVVWKWLTFTHYTRIVFEFMMLKAETDLNCHIFLIKSTIRYATSVVIRDRIVTSFNYGSYTALQVTLRSSKPISNFMTILLYIFEYNQKLNSKYYFVTNDTLGNATKQRKSIVYVVRF